MFLLPAGTLEESLEFDLNFPISDLVHLFTPSALGCAEGLQEPGTFMGLDQLLIISLGRL